MLRRELSGRTEGVVLPAWTNSEMCELASTGSRNTCILRADWQLYYVHTLLYPAS